MLVACVRMCVCAYVRVGGQIFTEKKRGKETQTLAKWAGSSASYHLPARTQPVIREFCFEGEQIFI